MPHYNDKEYFDAIPPKDEWKPTYWTPMLSTRTLGDDIADFMDNFLVPPRKMEKIEEYDEEGNLVVTEVESEEEPEEFRVRPWQRSWLRHAFELDEKTGLLRHNKIFLHIPRKNGKSFLASGIFLYFLFKAKHGDELYCAAKTMKQSRVVFDLCRDIVYANPLLQKVIKPSQHRLTNRFVKASLEPLASDGGGFMGKAPYATCGDELHAWDTANGTSTRGQSMLTSATTGSKDRNEWFFLGITTSGEHDGGLAHDFWEYGVQVSTNPEHPDKRFSFTSYMAEDDDDIYSPATWYKCNPSLTEGLLKLEEFQNDLTQAEGDAGGTSKFEIFALNKWIKAGDKAEFISGAQWENIRKPELGKIAKGSNICVGFDGSLTDDSTGIIATDERGLIEVLYAWEKDPLDPDWFVDVEEVNAAMLKVFSEYNVLKLYADPSRHQEVVKGWRKAYGSNIVREIPPSSSRMAPMSQEFKSAVLTGKVFHVGEKRLTTHVRNAIETIKGTPAKERAKSPRKVDFLICAILSWGAWQEVNEKRNRKTGRIGVI